MIERAPPFKPRSPGARALEVARAQGIAHHPPPRLESGYVPSRDGTRIFFAIESPSDPVQAARAASLPPLVFIYGLVCSALHWTYQITYFAQARRCVWIDFRGHQNADLPTDRARLTLADLADDVEAVLDALALGPCVLLGHSMGVNVVLELARRRPERVRGLVLANGTARRPLESIFDFGAGVVTHLSDAAASEALPDLGGVASFAARVGFGVIAQAQRFAPALTQRLWRLQGRAPAAGAVIHVAGFNPYLAHPDDVAEYVSEVSRMDPDVFVRVLESYQAFDATPWLSQLIAPALVISGERDWIVPPAEQQLLAQLLPHAELSTIPRGSHCPQMDLPVLITRQLKVWLDAIDPPA